MATSRNNYTFSAGEAYPRSATFDEEPDLKGVNLDSATVTAERLRGSGSLTIVDGSVAVHTADTPEDPAEPTASWSQRCSADVVPGSVFKITIAGVKDGNTYETAEEATIV